ncbi:nucleotidyltransferase domain-containing protein [Pseudomonas aeruginosa]|uniref:nucleotidyltransferase domain-containing protein n=1 Tax=Pseudomonas aeruginosa TaxID=287 RepID=UPI001EDE75E7|nr:nucleotidyltransferase domain-containing protein [Pseudomonas aeruginosa]
MDMPDGFIPLPPRVEPQAAFRPLLDDLRRTLARPPFERAVHSVYLYGSVARGEAITGRSDLDLTLVLRDPPSPELAAQLETARLALQARHPEVSKIDFDIGHLDQARDPANRDSWGYWLKHRCRCLWGEDLASDLPPLRPAKAIALALNGDYAQVLEDYARRLESASSEEERRLQREAAKKLIRSSDILRGETESVWPETLEHYLALFRARHPGQAPALEYFKAVLDGQVTDPAVFIERLDAAPGVARRDGRPQRRANRAVAPWALRVYQSTRLTPRVIAT